MARIVLEHRDLGDDVRRILEWLNEEGLTGVASAECEPSIDILETPEAAEIIADLPGIPPDSIRVVYSRGVLAVAGQKLPVGCQRQATFHLVERSFGRFARALRLSGAFDVGRAHAHLALGELHIVIPRIEERRGREIRIPIATE